MKEQELKEQGQFNIVDLKEYIPLKRLSCQYGTKLQTINGVDYYSFPTLKQLEKAKESELNELGFGYRSKYIIEATKQVQLKGGSVWLDGLRKKTADETQTELCELMGVGKKVADCVALFSLDQLHAVPVDTHVFQIAQRYMKNELKDKLNPAGYIAIRSFFEDTFGKLAGWAHTVLFAAELQDFKKEKNGEESKTKRTTKGKIEQSDEEETKPKRKIIEKIEKKVETESSTRGRKRKSETMTEKKTPLKKKIKK